MKPSLLVSNLAALVLAAAVTHAQLAPPQLAPVDRLLKSAQAYVAAHPAEADAHHTLARIHYLAFIRGAREVPVIRDTGAGEKPQIASESAIAFELYEARQKRANELALRDIGERGPRPSPEKVSAFEEARGRRARQLEEQDWHPAGNLPAPEMIAHAQAALAGLQKAGELEPRNGAHLLALGLLHEKVARWLAAEKPANVPAALRKLTLGSARTACLQAFRLALADDTAAPANPDSGIGNLVSRQAGEAYLRLADLDRTKRRATDKATLDEVRRGLDAVRRKRAAPLGL